MDTFFSTFKTIGDCLLPVIGLCVSICAISEKFKRWFKGMESVVRKSRCMPLIGVALGLFCIIFIISTIRAQSVQSRQQSSTYQRQLMLKHDAEQLAKDMLQFADNWPTNTAEGTAYWKFNYRFTERFMRVVAELDEQGQHSPDLERDSKLMLIYYSPTGFNAESVRQVSKIIQTLARGLPQ